MNNKIIAVAGPTASGKTALSVKIALETGGEVVSCDSMQIYKKMDIGTAKPTKKERMGVIHHMIDIADPCKSYNVVSYKHDAEAAIDSVLAKGKVPVLAGGTGLYMDAVLNNTAFSDVQSDPKVKKRLEEELEAEGAEAMHAKLEKVDPDSAKKIHPNNTRRLLRALEIFETTGKTMTEVIFESKRPEKYQSLVIGLAWDRETLYKRINKRVDEMMDAGLLGEVEALKKQGLDENTTAAQAIGYKELFEYLDGKCSLFEATEKIKQESRRYAKRQMTWFKRNKRINWLILQEDYNLNKIYEQAFTLIKKFDIM